jgi:RimJ/RimL family protein N-acetyltransferase
VIEGKRVRLRPIREDDLPLLRSWFDDPETMRYWGMPECLVPEGAFEDDLKGRFRQFDDAGYFMIERDEEVPIGRIDFENWDKRSDSVEVMILIGDQDGRGQGYGTDAMVALLRYLFHQRGLHRVWLTVIEGNERAMRSYEKVGFVVEGVLRDDVFFEGRFHSQHVMSMLRPEFDQRWGEVG